MIIFSSYLPCNSFFSKVICTTSTELTSSTALVSSSKNPVRLLSQNFDFLKLRCFEAHCAEWKDRQHDVEAVSIDTSSFPQCSTLTDLILKLSSCGNETETYIPENRKLVFDTAGSFTINSE